MVLDERHREQDLGTTLDQDVATKWQWILVWVCNGTWIGTFTWGTARTEGTVLEATHRVETTGVVVLVERQAIGRTVAVTVAQLGVQAHGVVVGQRLEQLATIVELEERQVAARRSRFQNQALGMTTGRQYALVQGRFDQPADALKFR